MLNLDQTTGDNSGSNETQLQQRRKEERQAKIEALAEKLYVAAISSDPAILVSLNQNTKFMSKAIIQASRFYQLFDQAKSLPYEEFTEILSTHSFSNDLTGKMINKTPE